MSLLEYPLRVESCRVDAQGPLRVNALGFWHSRAIPRPGKCASHRFEVILSLKLLSLTLKILPERLQLFG
jgi:hypothetical protein